MTKLRTTEDAISNADGNAFVAMTEKQMTSTKGGTAWPDWLDDLIDQFADLMAYLDEILFDPTDFDDNDWDELQEELEAEGFVPLTPEEIAQDW